MPSVVAVTQAVSSSLIFVPLTCRLAAGHSIVPGVQPPEFQDKAYWENKKIYRFTAQITAWSVHLQPDRSLVKVQVTP